MYDLFYRMFHLDILQRIKRITKVLQNQLFSSKMSNSLYMLIVGLYY